MKLFSSFKITEIFIIITALFLLFKTDKLCEKRENQAMSRHWTSKKNITVADFENQSLQNSPTATNDGTFHFGIYQCKTTLPFFTLLYTFGNDFYDQIFAWRNFVIILLFVHLFGVLYLTIFKFFHKFETVTQLNRIFVSFGICIWNFIWFWAIYQWFRWNSIFEGATTVPDFPLQFYAIFVLACLMDHILWCDYKNTAISYSPNNIAAPALQEHGYVATEQSDAVIEHGQQPKIEYEPAPENAPKIKSDV